ncbi:sulfite exporter TauE/SafE family protein [Paraferrimonas haliotis]|uniref:Cytochrome biogenesis protein n=1 Tax=Paraferrimonas haliotis TaxID=2013866 RepID=A0AA37WXH3_9GAMM|nr:sulfite exporter TauE/SafE family protein [Paraferrimonas haliotis]GLS84573.1 cytochrome biogenesis protein [Paraferrimonas haliotis]
MTELTPYAAFVVGLLGAGHCFGMCGGLMAAMSMAIKGATPAQRFQLLVGYNLGRIVSYALIGALIAAFTLTLAKVTQLNAHLVWLRVLAALLMMLTALYIAGINQWLMAIERLGQGVWRSIQPLAQRLLSVENPFQAFLAGMVWGWLPCGLVYSMLTWSLASADVQQGALLMAAFGVGTLPALLAIGVSAERLKAWVQNTKVRRLSALLLFAYATHTLVVALQQMR